MAALLLTGRVEAKDLFDLTLQVGNGSNATSASLALNTITDLANALKTENLSALSAAYSETSVATAVLNLRGVAATASYLTNGTTLNFSVPAAGINLNFTGATRNDSQQLFKDYLLKNGSGLITKLFQLMAASSPIDPVAGNPNSLQFASARSNFAIGTGIGLNGYEVPGNKTAQGNMLSEPNLIGAGGDIGWANSGGYHSLIATLPLRYTIPLYDPRYALTFDLPFTYVETGNSTSAFGSFGTALRIPVLDNWYITPGLRIGAAGSVDLGAAAVEYSGSVASRYDIYFDDLALTIGNGLTLVKTDGISIGSVSLNYNMFNQFFTNAVQTEGSLPFTLFGNPTSWQAYLADTSVSGNKVYVSHYDEIGFTLGSRHGLNGQDWSALRVGAGITVGEHYNAYKLGFTYRF